MKRILLLLSLMTLPIQAEEAKKENNTEQQEKKECSDSWTGWKLALNQMLSLRDRTATYAWGERDGATYLNYIFGGAVEYGWSLQNNLYIGVNTDVNINYCNMAEDAFLFIPKLTFKGGFTQGNSMAFLGAGLGYRFALSKSPTRDVRLFPTDKEGKTKDVPTWHFQVGGLYKISAKTFVGITWEYEKTFAKDDEITTPYTRKNISFGESRLIWKIGMQF